MGVSLSGLWWPFVFGVRCLWRHNFTSYSCFQINVLANLLTHYAYSSTRTLLILCVIALNINYQRSKGVKHTHHYIRVIYNCKIRLRECLVKYEQSSIGVRLDWLAHTRVCKIESCQTTQELKMRKSSWETFVFLFFIELQVFFFPCWSIIKFLNGSTLTTAVFELVQLFYHATGIGNVANAVSARAEQPIIVWDIVNYRGTQIFKMRSGRKVCKK